MNRDFLFIISCKRAQQFLSEDMDGALSKKNKILLRLHLAICTICRKARNQIISLKNGVKSLYSREKQDQLLPNAAKQQIKDALQSLTRDLK